MKKATQTLGRLEEVKNLRSVFPSEASDFTPWLADEENIELLGEAVGIDMIAEEREATVGSFHADIVAFEKDTEKRIIIENQLEETNHDHLGKLITYAAGKQAETVIWIVRSARDEHRAAIEWLNSNTCDNIRFFLCELKLFRIGNSEIAPKFEVIERPNEWAREKKEEDEGKKTANAQLYYEYWEEFQNAAFKNELFSKTFRRRKAGKHHWLTFSVGSSECSLNTLMLKSKGKIGVELYIKDNKELFKYLLESKEIIEKETGLTYSWKELPEKKACRIVIEKNAAFGDPSDKKTQFEWLISTMIKTQKSFSNFIIKW
ncbi:MAG: DUF4268 domain-containing protein [Clostridia bacterium]|nr:DUF4268 domain-containing protein [Clostridia bacterium]